MNPPPTSTPCENCGNALRFDAGSVEWLCTGCDRVYAACLICGQLERDGDCGCWGCGVCGSQMRKGEHCGCWLCRCCKDRTPYADMETTLLMTLASEPCSRCGHQQGACNCVECPRHCGFLHPPGFVCEPISDDELPF